MLKAPTLFTILLFASSVCFSQENAVDRLKLNKVVVEFEAAIQQKDSISFQKLFFDKNVAFVGVMSKETEMSIKKDYPEFQGVAVSNCTKFIKEICESEKKQVENFYNINIDSDGVIASIAFDYSFYSGPKMMQWGHEKWDLVYVDDQWLITDVIYSIRFPDLEPFPFAKQSEE